MATPYPGMGYAFGGGQTGYQTLPNGEQDYMVGAAPNWQQTGQGIAYSPQTVAMMQAQGIPLPTTAAPTPGTPGFNWNANNGGTGTTTLGSMASGTAQPQMGAQTSSASPLGGSSTGTGMTPGSVPLPGTNGTDFSLNPAAYQNPMAQTMQDWANKALQGTYAGAGDLLSGPAMQGITQYNQQAAMNNSYLPALNEANQQQQTGIGLGQYNQQFGYQQAMNNQTVPFQQQMQLANLGLQGSQGQQSVSNLLATLLSQNALGAGQAAGTGTIGASNSISNSISNALSNYLQQSLLNRIPGLNQTTGGTGT